MTSVAGRYARALADVVSRHRLDLDKVASQLDELATLISENEDLNNVFLNPAVEHSQKLGLLDAIMKRLGGEKLLRNFMAVLIDHHRTRQMKEIARQFRVELNERLGLAEAEVSSARRLGPSERKQLEARLADMTGKRVRATYREDAALLGGATVRVGSTIYDGSVRGQLDRLRQEITGT